MIGTQSLVDRAALVAALLLAGAMLFIAGVWVGSAGREQARDGVAESRTIPDWFLPIWDAYGRNPAVTPNFDFAALYAADGRVARLELDSSLPR